MIVRFGNKLAEDLFHGDKTKATRLFPPELQRIAQRKLQYVNAAKNLLDLRYHSIRINDQWRVVFAWKDSDAHDVRIIDYH